MHRSVVGIICNKHMINDQYPAQAAGETNVTAVAQVTGALPLLIPAIPEAIGPISDLIDVCDGFVLTGARPNVHPRHYGHAPTDAHGAFDEDRDDVALGLLHACIDRAVPILGICRGFQEFNVAFGGTLHPEIRDLPGRMNHRMPPDGTLEEKFEHRHEVSLTPGGRFAQIFGSSRVLVNSLHGQGIEEPGPRVIVEGYADDGTHEALYIDGAPGFAMAVQWHPEWNAAHDRVSRPLFEAFGQAMRSTQMARAV